MSIDELEFVIFAKKMFVENNSSYDKILSQLDEKSNPNQRLQIFAHFYYFICQPNNPNARDELQLIGMASLMEAMMAEVEYIDVFTFFEKQFKNQQIIPYFDFKEFKRNYLKKFGAARKVQAYCEKYISDEDKKIILSSIKVYKKNRKIGEFCPIENFNDFSKFLYDLRSEFVHKATMVGLASLNTDYTSLIAGKNYYALERDLNILNFMKIFEKSFVMYWVEKSKLKIVNFN